MENTKFTLTLEAVKNCIGFEKGSGLHTSLSGMCDCWFGIEKSKGATDEAAARVALDNLGNHMLKMSERQS